MAFRFCCLICLFRAETIDRKHERAHVDIGKHTRTWKTAHEMNENVNEKKIRRKSERVHTFNRLMSAEHTHSARVVPRRKNVN